jgi:glyoxylase-like metal-dependent hydrolase (beta-lactamase superfamily II)
MAEVTPGIYCLKLPSLTTDFSPTYVNAYLVRGDTGHLLVDAGWNTDEAFTSLQKQMAEIGADIEDISQIVITHIHPDHHGLVGRLKRLSRATLAFHESEKEFIKPRYVNTQKMLEQTAQWLRINGVPPDKLQNTEDTILRPEQFFTPTKPDITLHDGETITTGIFTFQVLWTPGHSPGHICLYEPDKKILIAGDHILPTITTSVGKHPQSLENPLGMYLDSLNDLRKLDIELVLPGHENPFTELKPRIDELLQYHENKMLEILAIIRGEAKTAYQIATEITLENDTGWQDMSLPQNRMIISKTLARLELMRINGQISKTSRDGVIYYRQN